MKNIAVLERVDESRFISFMEHTLDSLNLKFSFVKDYNIHNAPLDYVVLNSSTQNDRVQVKTEYCLANMDGTFGENINVNGNIITYGFGIKNTVTVSSVEDNNLGFVYCLQRYLDLNAGGVLEPQEIPIKLEFESDVELHASMAAITIALIEGINSSKIEKKLSKKNFILA